MMQQRKPPSVTPEFVAGPQDGEIVPKHLRTAPYVMVCNGYVAAGVLWDTYTKQDDGHWHHTSHDIL